MKDQKILILLIFSFMFTSCGITFPYLNEQNERFDKIYKGKIYIDENISRTCFEFDVVARKFKHQPYYILQISQMSYGKELPCPYISVVLHSLVFLNNDGDTIPYSLSYKTFHPSSDLLNVEIKNELLHIVFGDTAVNRICGGTHLDIRGEPATRANPIKIYYDIEINGERLKGECRYRRRMQVESRWFRCLNFII